MRRGDLISVLGVLLVLAAYTSTVSAVNTLYIQGLTLTNIGDKGTIDLKMDSAPTGLSGYSIKLTISPTTVAQFDTGGSMTFPSGVVAGYYLPSLPLSDTSTLTIKVADVGKVIPNPSAATNFKLGSAPVKAMARGFATVSIQVNQLDDESGTGISATTVPGNIAVNQPQGWLWVNTTPVPGAQIFIDNVQQMISGSTPRLTNASFLADYGTHTVKVSLSGYVDAVKYPVSVTSVGSASNPPASQRVTFALTRTGNINARSSPSGATITVDGTQYSTPTPYTVTGLDPNNPPAGHLVLEAKADYYGCRYNGVKVNPGATTYLTICTLTPVKENDYKPYGSIDVDTTPEGASISIKSSDGSVIVGPLTPGTKEVAPGTYTVSVALDGYVPPPAQSVTVETHQMSHLDFQFQTKITPGSTCLWPPDHSLVDMTLKDAKGKILTVTGITSDEVTATEPGSGGSSFSPDAFIKKGGSSFQLRRERSGNGNGRVYRVSGKTRTGLVGAVTVCVPFDMTNPCTCIDDGQNFDATKIN